MSSEGLGDRAEPGAKSGPRQLYSPGVMDERIWVGLVDARPQHKGKDKSQLVHIAYATVVTPAADKKDFQRAAAELAREHGKRLDHVVIAEPADELLAPRSDPIYDTIGFYAAVAPQASPVDVRGLVAQVTQDGVPRSEGWEVVHIAEAPTVAPGERALARLLAVLFWVGVPVIAALLLPFLVQDLGPAYRARSGEGAVGVFTATDRSCNPRRCLSSGYWTADDGGRVRDSVALGSGGDAPRPGETVKALDTGDDNLVYPAKRNWDWLDQTALLVGLLGLLLAWSFLLVRRLRQRFSH
jgi:hypothetical protein